ncbi:serine protease trypsin-like protein [Plasmopara halstedii]|uniref:Serine protease trypsin-like protein n=1 Tax=Plasmopara halstedii TaxID=4781 RepID=A0A0P1AER5_PLAHL|nr:serine protease trypsin-like protein [Plasmopara halstedii]CEG39152.1 serine protease trypsin-like protein [Plasmopara halstedii]|eukprot:XP_024575521.1 serine protease trypsin-like protein [Plasmopara halstedii]
MKFTSTISAASIAISGVVANADHASRQLIIGGKVVEINTKTYTTCLRSKPDADCYCAGALVSHRHVLTSAMCGAYQPDGIGPYFVTVGAHSMRVATEGEHFKVVQVQNHTKHDVVNGSYDLALLTLDRPCTIPPIELAKQDDSDIKPGMWTKVMGWGLTSYPGEYSNELRSLDVEVWSDAQCMEFFQLDESYVCSGGFKGIGPCDGDLGGPLILEQKKTDPNGPDLPDILIGISSWGYGCAEGSPDYNSRISTSVDWITSVIGNVTCADGTPAQNALPNPGNAVQNPGDVVQNPGDAMQNPDNLLQNPDKSAQNPDNVVQNPDNVMQNPDNSVQNPDNAVQHPDNAVQNPENMVQHPENGEQNPENTVQTPENAVQNPENTVQNPENATSNPGNVEQMPNPGNVEQMPNPGNVEQMPNVENTQQMPNVENAPNSENTQQMPNSENVVQSPGDTGNIGQNFGESTHPSGEKPGLV